MKQSVMLRHREGLRRLAWSLFLFILIFCLPHSSQASNLYKFHPVAMGTLIEITLMSDQEERANQAALRAFLEVKRIEQLMSSKIGFGDVFRINQSAHFNLDILNDES